MGYLVALLLILLVAVPFLAMVARADHHERMHHG